MKCAWQELLRVLPVWMRRGVDGQGRDSLLELRLRLNQRGVLLFAAESRFLEQRITEEDLSYIINAASKYSPWAATTVSKGFLTVTGGHRIGVCGEAVVENGTVRGIRTVRSLCIRVARDYSGIAAGIPDHGSVLILGKPGAGKTTLLRDLIRHRARMGGSIAVLDERGELFPNGFDPGNGIDVLTGCGKKEGIPMLLRTMGPGIIASDEITEEGDAEALCSAGNCGVTLLATAHGATVRDLKNRGIYRKLLEQGLFQHFIILQEDKSWRTERISI